MVEFAQLVVLLYVYIIKCIITCKKIGRNSSISEHCLFVESHLYIGRKFFLTLHVDLYMDLFIPFGSFL